MAMEKTFDAGREEPEIYDGWERAGAFRAGAGAAPGAESFCIMIPPPNVTGSLHMGHAFNNTLQDILIRWKRMQGFDVLWQPGTDHAGIATQMVTEREMAANGEPARREMGREAFVRRVWQQKVRSRGTIIGQLKRLGASCDWSREAFTMSGAPGAPEGEEGNFHDAVIRAFVELYNRGAIHRGKRLVNWDPHFETAISDLEVEQVEVDGHLWHLRYRLADGLTYRHPTARDEDGNVTATEARDYLVVATTRPETMLGDTGVAVHPDDPRYAHLVGHEAILPLIGRRIPIVADPHADPEKGTGAVKITPAHDFNDWEVGQRCGLRAVNVMTTRAAMWLKDNPDFAAGCDAEGVARVIEAIDGADRYEARDWIVEMARQEEWLDDVQIERHMVPHGDRSKVAVEPYLTNQWFVDAAKLVQPAIDEVRRGLTRGEGDTDARGKPAGTAILPEQDAKVYFNWLENIEPWCISRQLWWGHQVPVWYGPDLRDCRPGVPQHEYKRFCGANENEVRAQAQDYYGESVEIEFDDAASAAGGFGAAYGPVVDGSPLRRLTLGRDPDVLDTWFSSGLWPIGTLGWPEDTPELKKYFPTSVLVTGFDIIFFWVARMMMMQHALVGERPFHTVYVHALVRDAEGKKMSKSLGNVLDPIELIDEFGADAVRFTLASLAAMGRDVKLSKDRIAGYRNFTTKLWNAARFAEMNGAVPEPGFDPSAVRETVNRWIVAETARARAATDAALEGFRFNDAANGLYAFVWGRVCDWYLEFAKPLLDGPAAAETRATLAWVIDQCLILLHPVMPYVTEALWGRIAARERMLILADWPRHGAELHAPAAEDEIGWVITLIEELRSARAELGVPAGARLALLVVDLDGGRRAALDRHWPLVARLARLAEVADAPEVPRGAVTVALEGGTLALPLAGHVDIAAETARLEKARAKLAKEIAGLQGRLANDRFLANAPDAVVEDTRAQARARADEAARLDAALARLAEAAS